MYLQKHIYHNIDIVGKYEVLWYEDSATFLTKYFNYCTQVLSEQNQNQNDRYVQKACDYVFFGYPKFITLINLLSIYSLSSNFSRKQHSYKNLFQ